MEQLSLMPTTQPNPKCITSVWNLSPEYVAKKRAEPPRVVLVQHPEGTPMSSRQAAAIMNYAEALEITLAIDWDELDTKGANWLLWDLEKQAKNATTRRKGWSV